MDARLPSVLALAAVVAALAFPPHASGKDHSTTHVLYPTGAGGPTGDHYRLQALIDSSAVKDGDTLLLKARKQGEAAVTPWMLGLPAYDGSRTVTTPGGQFTFSQLAPHVGLGELQPLYIYKAVTIRGELGAGGAPLTRLINPEEFGFDSTSGFFMPMNKKSVIRDLYFFTGAFIFAVHPADLINCVFDESPVPLTALIDDRVVEPSVIRDCRNVGPVVRSFGHTWGWSHLTIENCEFNDLGAFGDFGVFDNPWIIGAEPGWADATDGVLRPGKVHDVTIKDCRFSNTNGVEKFIPCLVLAAPGGEASDIRFIGNTFNDQQNPFWAPISVIADGGSIRDIAIVGNTFSGASTSYGVELANFGGSLSGVAVVNNTWSGTDETTAAVSAYDDVNDCTLIGNDFRRGTWPGWTSGGAGCVHLGHNHGNLVIEWRFPSGTNLCDQVRDQTLQTDPPLGNNRVVGWFGICDDALFHEAEPMVQRTQAEPEQKLKVLGDPLERGLGRGPTGR